MDAKLAFWTWALANFVAVVVLGLDGVRHIRAGRVHAHRRRMLTAAGFVGLFLVSYLSKVAFVGREDRSQWSDASLVTLYVHETCVAVMLLAACVAWLRTRRFGKLQDGVPPSPEAREPDRRVHRRAGRVALVAGGLALLTAAGVLAGMYGRAGS
ncbi:MAG: DUF420 domain-containing protein [Myxococcota bacterium]